MPSTDLRDRVKSVVNLAADNATRREGYYVHDDVLPLGTGTGRLAWALPPALAEASARHRYRNEPPFVREMLVDRAIQKSKKAGTRR